MRGAAIQFSDLFDCFLLLGEARQSIAFSTEVKRRPRLCHSNCREDDRAAWRKRGENIWSLRPKQIGKQSAVRKSRRINAPLIRGIFFAQARQDRVDKFQIAVVQLTGVVLPARSRAFLIENKPGGWQSLQINDDCFRPRILKMHPARGKTHVSAMAVKGENDRRLSFTRCLWHKNKRLALRPFHRPLHQRGLARENSRGEAKKKRDESFHED